MRWLLLVLVACGGAKEKPVVSVEPRPAPTVVASAPPATATGQSVRVHFEGLVDLKESDLQRVVAIDKPKKEIGSSNRDVLERDTLLVQAELYDRGYINMNVKEPRIDIGADGVIDITFHVQENGRYRNGKVWLEELDDNKKPLTPLETIKRAKDGDWFSRKVLVDDIHDITTKYRDAGYAFADITPETELDVAKRTVDVKVAIKRGPIVTFHAIEIDPPSATVAADAARKFGVKPGARFSETALEQIKQDLTRQGVRNDLSIRNVKGKADAVDVVIEVH